MATIEELQAEVSNLTTERDELKAGLATANGEAKGHRLNANKLKGQLETLQAEHDTLTNERDGLATKHSAELERVRIDLTAQLNAKDTELTSRINADKDARTNGALEAAAAKLGMPDMDFLKLLDRSGLKVAEDGTPENVDEVLTRLKTDKPHLFGGRAPGTLTGTTTTTFVPPKRAPDTGPDIRTMKREDYVVARKAHLAEQR